MNNCKYHKIYKFKYAIRINSDKRQKESWRRAQLITKFKEKFIDSFAKEKWEDINIKCFEKKYKNWYDGSYTIGLEQIEEFYNVQFERQWSSLYIGVPLTNKKMIKFMDKNVPDYVTTVQKI